MLEVGWLSCEPAAMARVHLALAPPEVWSVGCIGICFVDFGDYVFGAYVAHYLFTTEHR